MPATSREFEELTAAIKRALEPRQDVVVTPHARVLDSVTQRSRDFDVLIEANVSGSPLRIGVECRHKKRRVDKPQVEAFVTKLRDCKVDKGVLVSSSGFTEEALAAAANDRIICCALKEVERLPWIQLISFNAMRLSNTRITNVTLTYHVRVNPTDVQSPIEVLVDGYAPTPWNQYLTQLLAKAPLPLDQEGQYECTMEFDTPDAFIRFSGRDDPVPLKTIALVVEYDAIKVDWSAESWLYAPGGTAPTAGTTRVRLGDFHGKPLFLDFIVTAATKKSP